MMEHGHPIRAAGSHQVTQLPKALVNAPREVRQTGAPS